MDSLITFAKENYDLICLLVGLIGIIIGIISVVAHRGIKGI